MINLETLDLKSLPSVPLENKNELPAISGIYFAIDSLEVVQYIGKTVNLQSRFSFHNRLEEFLELGKVTIAYLEINNCRLLLEIEKALIYWFKPRLNTLRLEITKKESQRLYKNAVNKLIAAKKQQIDRPTSFQKKVKLSFSQWFKLRRDIANLTQAQIAKRLGVKPTTISNWEKGVSKSRPNKHSMFTARN